MNINLYVYQKDDNYFIVKNGELIKWVFYKKNNKWKFRDNMHFDMDVLNCVWEYPVYAALEKFVLEQKRKELNKEIKKLNKAFS